MLVVRNKTEKLPYIMTSSLSLIDDGISVDIPAQKSRHDPLLLCIMNEFLDSYPATSE